MEEEGVSCAKSRVVGRNVAYWGTKGLGGCGRGRGGCEVALDIL